MANGADAKVLKLATPSAAEAPRHPWLQFFPQDWQGDELLSMCSLAARGLLIELVCLMHKAIPYGYLLVNGHPPSDRDLMRLVRATSTSEVRKLRNELLDRGVLSVTADGIVYSRRLVRMAQLAATNSRNGRKGAHARWAAATDRRQPRDVQRDAEQAAERRGADGARDGEQGDERDAGRHRDRHGDGYSDRHGDHDGDMYGPIFQKPEARSPQPPKGALADERTEDIAGAFLERYPEIYARCRNGATYRVSRLKQERDLAYARELALTWPDLDRLGAMLELFLRRQDLGDKNMPGTPGQFLHMASDCDRLLKERGL